MGIAEPDWLVTSDTANTRLLLGRIPALREFCLDLVKQGLEVQHAKWQVQGQMLLNQREVLRLVYEQTKQVPPGDSI